MDQAGAEIAMVGGIALAEFFALLVELVKLPLRRAFVEPGHA
jgi:hypothetical protein